MGYRNMNVETMAGIWSRLVRGESKRSIATKLDLDRKTVCRYADLITAAEIPAEMGYTKALGYLQGVLGRNVKAHPSRDVFEPLACEIRSLIEGNRNEHREPMKPKTAWLVIRDRHGLASTTSYTSFKRYVQENGLTRTPLKAVARIESEPGEETQLDYGKMGTWHVVDRGRTIYAYIGVLAASRLPFIQFVTSQDQLTFARSTVAMVEYYGGATRRFVLDNLKAGVISPDIYDPTINRTFAELCDHYGVIADPAAVRAPKHKAKVERFVPVAREMWKRLTALHPQATLDELNDLALALCRGEYGAQSHGTTGRAPTEAFETVERERLLPLPQERFEPAAWNIGKVHPDQFVATGKKLYGMPAAYIGKTVQIRSTGSFVELFYNNVSIRKYAVPSKKTAYLPEDFPDYAEPFKPGSYTEFLRAQAAAISPQAGAYMGFVVEHGGQLAIRRGQGCLDLLRKHKDMPGLSHVIGMAMAQRVTLPARLKVLLEDEFVQKPLPFSSPAQVTSMTRPASYYTGS